MGFWGLEVKPGKPQAYNPDEEQRKLHLTQATLGDGLGKESSVIQCSIGGNAPVYLCSLLPNKTECCPLNLEFGDDDGTVEFSVTGHRSIHLSGFLEAYDEECGEEEDEEDDDDEYGIDIGESESGESEYDDSDEDELEEFLDHSLDMYRQSVVPNSGVVIEEIEDEEKATAKDDKTKRSKKKSQASKDEKKEDKQIIVKESDHAPVLESEDEDGFPIPKEKAPEPEKKSAAKMELVDDEQGSNKKRKAKASEQESANKNKKKKNQKEKKNEVNASKEEADEQVETGKVLEKKEEASQSSPDQKAQNGAVNNATSESSKTPVESAEKKKKKKKKSNEKATEETKVISSRTYPNGLVVEEIKMGKPNSKKATPGKKVSVCYTGKLQKNGEVFDSNTKETPLEFRLGVGQVIKGWDVGVNGMRIGDKRKLTIPPSMGYGTSGAGEIPPNAWLTFDVELLDVK
ncbi:unnamed protein product [Eruca vesicaria subsp. sativa]|uniref:FK506-binding protein n=1 Tax=Eruca vesicaria subsp. sativa TaxID=29727 RepID=A0ABC8IW79_ERUVS|nr:unnamed protein product [Eruca vesicaria subsp. sativa]